MSADTTTAAIVGAGTPVGRAVVAGVSGVAGVDRLLAVDATTSTTPHPDVEVRVMDHRDRLLGLTLEDVDVLVHCAFEEDLAASPDSLYGANVGGTRNVLSAASKAGVRHLVVLSSAMAYGARADNPLPLTEDAPLRANPGFAYGYQRQLVEELVDDWRDAHPTATVTVLRTAPVLGTGAGSAVARRLLAPRLPVPAGQSAPWQLVHAEDVATAVRHVIAHRLGGIFNVAADGWLSDEEVAHHLGRRVLPIGQATLTAVLHRGTELGLSPAPPEVMPYLLHPWVLDTTRLRASGWRPTWSNRDILVQLSQAHAGELALGRLTVRRGTLRRTASGGVCATALLLWLVARRWRRRA